MSRLNNLKNRAAINAKISVVVICVEAIIYLLIYNLRDCTFKPGADTIYKHISRSEVSNIDKTTNIIHALID